MEIERGPLVGAIGHVVGVRPRLRAVSATDACLLVRDRPQPLELRLPAYSAAVAVDDDDDDDFASRRERTQRAHGRRVSPTALYPIVPPDFAVAQLQPSLWSDATNAHAHWLPAWRAALWDTGYAHLPTSAADYRATIGVADSSGDVLGIFGPRRNAIAPVIHIASELNRPELLLHYICVVVLQFYLCARDLWMQARTDAAAPFSEALPAHIFLMFRVADWCCTDALMAEAPPLVTRVDVDREVRRQSFPCFLFQVLRWLQQRYPQIAKLTNAGDMQVTKDGVVSFCVEKLRKNFLQSLMCMRFREIWPRNAVARINESLSMAERRDAGEAADCVIKFFPHPNAASIASLDTKTTPKHVIERVPLLFAHLFFAPSEPLLVVEDDAGADADAVPHAVQRRLLADLLRYYPLSDFRKHVMAMVRRVWRSRDNNVVAACVDDRHLAARLGPVRARYTFYVRQNEVFAYVPSLLAAEGEAVEDECDPRWISPLAWRWYAARAEASSSPGATSPNLNELEHSIMARHLDSDVADARPFWTFWCFMRRCGDESQAVRALVASGVTHAALCESARQIRDCIVAHMQQLVGVQRMAQLARRWDRCRPLPAFALSVEEAAHEDALTALRLGWRVLVPSAVIGFGPTGAPWITEWRCAEAMPRLTRALSAVQTILTRRPLLDELTQALPRLRLTAAHRQTLGVLCAVLATCDSTKELRALGAQVFDALQLGAQ